MTIDEARALFLQGGATPEALLEAARQYAEAREYSVPGLGAWEQARLLLQAIAVRDSDLDVAQQALRLWQISPGASGRLNTLDPTSKRRIGVTDAAEAAGVSRAAVHKAIYAGRLHAERNATGSYEITWAEFLRWRGTLRAPNRK